MHFKSCAGQLVDRVLDTFKMTESATKQFKKDKGWEARGMIFEEAATRCGGEAMLKRAVDRGAIKIRVEGCVLC